MTYKGKKYKEIQGFADYYISREGEVISTKPGRNCVKGEIKELNPVVNSKGYYQYYLLRDDATKASPMQHQLLMRTYVDNVNKFPYINHIDGNKLNNTLSNLEWCTPKHNTQHAIRTGLLKTDYCAIQVYMYTLSGVFVREFSAIKEAALHLKCDAANIVTHLKGRSRHAKGFQFSYTKENTLPKYVGPVVLKHIIVVDLETQKKYETDSIVGLSKITGIHRASIMRRFKKSGVFYHNNFKVARFNYE